MRKLVLVVLVTMFGFSSAYAQKDTSDLRTIITSNFPDNVAGFITPERLRNVSLEIMRSSLNKLEANSMSGVLTVGDSIKTTDGFYRWTGSEWASVSDDTTAWGRSGGFILPLNYSDKLSIDTARVEGLLYPNGSVNIGRKPTPFDSIYSNNITASSLTIEGCDSTTVGQVLANTGAGVACWTDPCCPLDDAYDSGGAGLGREIIADAGAVKISGEDGLLITGTFGSGAAAEISGAGTRMFFNPAKAAFRVGSVLGSGWDDANIGDYSFASGSGSIASGNESTAMGAIATASGESSFAAGDSPIASGDISVAIGSGTTASGEASTAIGNGTTASGDISTSMGLGTTAESYLETAIGAFNTDYTPTSTIAWNATDRLFVIGNGQSTGTRSDALVMLKNGNAGLGTSTPDTTLHLVGQMKYIDGNQGEYKYLTSDANGNASWGPDGCFTGWESITDNTNSYAITGGDTVTIAIQRDVVINSQLPCGIDSLWNMTDSTIIGRDGDALNISLDWTATQNTNTATEFKWWVNIGGAVGIIYPTTYDQSKGNGVPKQYNKTTTVYTLDTWETNGGKIQFAADQNLTISDVRINIFRIHKAR
jgi:hypothetical protein